MFVCVHLCVLYIVDVISPYSMGKWVDSERFEAFPEVNLTTARRFIYSSIGIEMLLRLPELLDLNFEVNFLRKEISNAFNRGIPQSVG